MMPRHYAEVLDFDADLVLSKSQVNAVLTYLEDDEKVLSRKYIIALWNCKALRQGHAFDG